MISLQSNVCACIYIYICIIYTHVYCIYMCIYIFKYFCSICRAKETKSFRNKGGNWGGRSFGILITYVFFWLEKLPLFPLYYGFLIYWCLWICRFGKWTMWQEVSRQILRLCFLLRWGSTKQIWTTLKEKWRKLYLVC